jgi:hypothetical protein
VRGDYSGILALREDDIARPAAVLLGEGRHLHRDQIGMHVLAGGHMLSFGTMAVAMQAPVLAGDHMLAFGTTAVVCWPCTHQCWQVASLTLGIMAVF